MGTFSVVSTCPPVLSLSPCLVQEKRIFTMKCSRMIIIAAILLAVLATAWFTGGGFSGPETPGATAFTSVPAPENGESATAGIDRAGSPITEAELVESTAALPGANSPATGSDPPGVDGNPTGEADSLPNPAESLPTTPQNGQDIGEKVYHCTLAVRCDTILNNPERLNKDKATLVPDGGVLFPATTVTFYEGESVFNLLQREMKNAGIHMAFRSTPVYKAAYIEAINNIYELDCGELSGWMYRVNGNFPGYGCSRYLLSEGDAVEWLYSCDLGRDVGGAAAAAGQAK